MASGRFEIQFFAGLLLLSAALMIFVFYPCLNALVIAIALAVIFHPIYARLLRLMPKWEWLAALITVMLTIAVILVPLTIFGFKIFAEAQALYTSFASGDKGPLLEFLHGKLAELTPGLNLDLTQYTQQILSALLGNLGFDLLQDRRRLRYFPAGAFRSVLSPERRLETEKGNGKDQPAFA